MPQENKKALQQELCDALRACDETKAVDCIRRGADVNAPDANGYTPIFDAIKTGNVDAIRLIAKLGGDLHYEHAAGEHESQIETPALYAMIMRQDKALECLFELGISPNDTNSMGFSLLMLACEYPPCGNWAEPLIERGADIKARSKAGRTAFGYVAIDTCYCGDELVALLLEMGADINEQDEFGETALMAYAYGENESPEFINFFLEHGADPNIRNIRGQTALDIALEHNWYAARRLMEYGGKQGKDLPEREGGSTVL